MTGHIRPPQRRNARIAGVLVIMACLLLLAGCASAPQVSPATREALPDRVKLDDVPFHGQRDYQCGPASLAMVLNAGGRDASVDALIPQVFLPGREGSVQPEMLATVRRQGMVPFRIPGEYDALLEELAAGNPVVVMQNLALPAWPLWHYAVAIGYDLPDESLTLHSGMTPERVVDVARFDATWARSDRWAFVALAPGRLPASVGVDAAIRAIADFESAQGNRAALPAWQALAERHPDAAMVQFALGNARHATGDGPGALAAYRAATTADPELAPGWLNLGLLASREGDLQTARQALDRAAALPGPWQARARAERASLDQEAEE
ncbi:PA2778 family cysteine peptidase [Halomonas nitroreducens]|uniref:Tetratricopeptide repeat protein n=1 Tax=Halomonas nitroreducens TaxID=447425 RepID=A0A431V7K0_9GAMM|nr:PA2778 family cysteine peptidase [Halomonas nitroreducens]RTR05366.1 tetratricopeptide repeat protein [Halomonas nitroreducens]